LLDQIGQTKIIRPIRSDIKLDMLLYGILIVQNKIRHDARC